MRPGLASQRSHGAIEMTDDRALSAALEKADGGIDLGSHASRREMALAVISLDLAQG